MNNFKKILYNIARSYVKNYLTGNLGKVIEDDERITCYVKRNKVKKKNYTYCIACFGIGKKQKEVAETYKLNKPICYVIDDLELKKDKIYIFGYNDCEVIIKNCNFGFDAHIHVNGKCTLDNTNIRTFSHLTIGADELIIKNMCFDEKNVIVYTSDISFGANDRIDVIDSNISNGKKNIKFSFLANNKLNIINSSIYGNDVVCEANNINVNENSSLAATNKVAIKADNFNEINITAPTIELNGEKITTQKKSILLKKLTEPLALKRLELTTLLRKIKTECENINSDKILEYKEELNIQPISKVLKR